MNSRTHPSRLAGQVRLRILGQESAVHRLASAIARGEAGLADPTRPRGTFLLLGPTGVGKTALCHALAEEVSNRRPSPLKVFDMADYQDASSFRRFLGPNPDLPEGILGAGLREPFESGSRWILFDEIEKAHPRLQTFFLGPLETGRITLGNGREISLLNDYLFFTSNLGGKEVAGIRNLNQTTLERHSLSAAERHFRPEIFNRFSERIVFQNLGFKEQREICTQMIHSHLNQLAGRMKIRFTFDDHCVSALLRRGFHRSLGARPLRETVIREIGNGLLDFWEQGHEAEELHFSARETTLIVSPSPG